MPSMLLCIGRQGRRLHLHGLAVEIIRRTTEPETMLAYFRTRVQLELLVARAQAAWT